MSDLNAPTTKPPRSALLTFCQAVLALEALVVLFATILLASLVTSGQVDLPLSWVWIFGVGLMVGMLILTRYQAKPAGRLAATLLQIPMLVVLPVVPAVAFIGIVFLVVWVMGLRLGSKIDRERAAFNALRRTQGTHE